MLVDATQGEQPTDNGEPTFASTLPQREQQLRFECGDIICVKPINKEAAAAIRG